MTELRRGCPVGAAGRRPTTGRRRNLIHGFRRRATAGPVLSRRWLLPLRSQGKADSSTASTRQRRSKQQLAFVFVKATSCGQSCLVRAGREGSRPSVRSYCAWSSARSKEGGRGTF